MSLAACPAVGLWIREMRRVIAQSGMDLVGDSIDQPAQEIPGDTPGHALVRFGASDLALYGRWRRAWRACPLRAIPRRYSMWKHPIGSVLNVFLGLDPSTSGQSADVVTLKPTLQRGSPQMWDAGLQRVTAVIERWQPCGGGRQGLPACLLRTGDRGPFGPIGASLTPSLLFHVTTVLGPRP